MTLDEFRELALQQPQAVEGAHVGHADFRVGGKIFASLGNPDENWAMVKLAPEDQVLRVEAEPTVFEPAPGTWGRGGSTRIRLAATDRLTAQSALAAAWRNIAPKKLVEAARNLI